MSSPLGMVFAMDIDGTPTMAFEAKNHREASELCKEDWLRADLSVLTSNGIPLLCTAAAKLTVRRATESETQVYRDADREAQACDDLLLAYLVELDGSGPLQLYSFDCLALDGEDLRKLPMSMRKANRKRLRHGRPDRCQRKESSLLSPSARINTVEG